MPEAALCLPQHHTNQCAHTPCTHWLSLNFHWSCILVPWLFLASFHARQFILSWNVSRASAMVPVLVWLLGIWESTRGGQDWFPVIGTRAVRGLQDGVQGEIQLINHKLMWWTFYPETPKRKLMSDGKELQIGVERSVVRVWWKTHKR